MGRAATPKTLIPIADVTSAQDGTYVAMVPGEDAPLVTLDLPEGLRGAVREQVAQRQYLDRTAQPTEHVEFRPVTFDDAQWSKAISVDAGKVQVWRETVGNSCLAILPDYLCLPAASGLWVLDADKDGNLRARLGISDGFSCNTTLAPIWLEQALQDTPPEAVLLSDNLDHLVPQLEAAEIPHFTSTDALTKAGHPAPAQFAHGELTLDLRRDPRAARARLARRVLPWRWPAIAACLAAALWAGEQITATQAARAQIASTHEITTTLMRQYFVPQGPILDARTQVLRVLDTRRRDAAASDAVVSGLALFGQAADVIAASGAEAQSVAYTPADGLSLTVRVADFTAAEALLAKLGETTLEVVQSQARADEADDGVNLDLRIDLGEAS